MYAVDSERQEGHPIPKPSSLTDEKIQKEVEDLASSPENKEVHLRLFSVDYIF